MEEQQGSVGKFLDPNAIIAQVDVTPGATVADFGCGPGYFTIPFAKIIGEEGKIYALDILPQTLETVSSKAKSLGITNVLAKRVNLEKEGGSKLESESIDLVILKDILFQNQHKDAIIKESLRILKKNGKAVVVEWNHRAQMMGPAMELRIVQSELEKMFVDNGFIIEKNVEAGDFHYSFVAMKN